MEILKGSRATLDPRAYDIWLLVMSTTLFRTDVNTTVGILTPINYGSLFRDNRAD